MMTGKCFPYFTLIAQFPLTGGNILDKAIHPVSTFSFHLLGDVTVGSKRADVLAVAPLVIENLPDFL